MTRRPANKEQGTFERHAQSIVAAVILAIVLWTGTTMQEIREQSKITATEVAVFQKSVAERVASLQSDVTSIRAELQRLTEEKFRAGEVQTKVLDLEARMRVVEKDHARIAK